MKEIAETGYWNGETAHVHHVHCTELAKFIAEYLKDFKSKRLYDMGCGMGNYLADLHTEGFYNILGLEGDIPKNSIWKDTIKQDLTIPLDKEFPRGNVISLEVGEHIPKEYQDAYIDNITNFCDDYLITSWAIRGQAGFGHVNCLDNQEIIPMIESRGFKLLKEDTEKVRSIDLSQAPWFKNTLFIFKR